MSVTTNIYEHVCTHAHMHVHVCMWMCTEKELPGYHGHENEIRKAWLCQFILQGN